MRSLVRSLAALAALLPVLPVLPLLMGIARAQGSDSLTIAAALSQASLPSYIPPSVSPDGHAVAYTICVADTVLADTLVNGFAPAGTMGPAFGCRVWVAAISDGATARLGGETASNEWAPQWSPDGRKVAFYSDAGGTARLWVWDAATKVVHAVSDAVVRPYTPLEGPRWTPDSRGIVTRIRAAGATHLSAEVGPHVAGVSWDTIGRASGSTVVIYHTDSVWRSRPSQVPATVSIAERFYEGDLALIKVNTGDVQILAHGYRPFAYWVSPDGKYVALTSLHGTANAAVTAVTEFREDLLVARLNGGGIEAPRVVADGAVISPFGTGVAWSPDGSTLAYAETQPDGTDRYCLVRTADWRLRAVVPPDPIRHALLGRSGGQPLRWDPTGSALYIAADTLVVRVRVEDDRVETISRPPIGTSIVAFIGPATQGVAWEPGGSSLVMATRNDSSKQMGFAAIDLHTGAWKQITDGRQYLGQKLFLSSDVSANGRRLVFASESATRPQDLWSASPTLRDARRVTDIAASMSGHRFGETRLIQWRTASGQRVRGTLLLPAGYEPGHRYPMIVYPYPLDLRSNDIFQFGVEGPGTENMQLFATRGYAVLAPDAPIVVSDQMRSLADVILPGVDQAVAMGIADSTRLGVMGHSWGGYTVLALLVQTRRFRAAVMRGGMGDLVAEYGEMEPTGSTFGQLRLESWFRATMWQDLPRYIDNSPVFFLDRVRTPLLIIQGGAETTVVPHLAAEIFADLRRLGGEVEYALYGGENHGEGEWRFGNKRDYLARTIQWFDAHLSDTASVKSDVGLDRVGGQIRR